MLPPTRAPLSLTLRLSSPTGEPARTKPGLGTRYIIIIAVAAFTVVAGATTLLILRYQRMKGKYSLRIQTDDFSYQVFAQ